LIALATFEAWNLNISDDDCSFDNIWELGILILVEKRAVRPWGCFFIFNFQFLELKYFSDEPLSLKKNCRPLSFNLQWYERFFKRCLQTISFKFSQAVTFYEISQFCINFLKLCGFIWLILKWAILNTFKARCIVIPVEISLEKIFISAWHDGDRKVITKIFLIFFLLRDEILLSHSEKDFFILS